MNQNHEAREKQCEICGRVITVYPNSTTNCPTCGTVTAYDDYPLNDNNSILYHYGKSDDNREFRTPIYGMTRQVKKSVESYNGGIWVLWILLGVFIVPIGSIISVIAGIKQAKVYPEHVGPKLCITICSIWMLLTSEIWLAIGYFLFEIIVKFFQIMF